MGLHCPDFQKVKMTSRFFYSIWICTSTWSKLDQYLNASVSCIKSKGVHWTRYYRVVPTVSLAIWSRNILFIQCQYIQLQGQFRNNIFDENLRATVDFEKPPAQQSTNAHTICVGFVCGSRACSLLQRPCFMSTFLGWGGQLRYSWYPYLSGLFSKRATTPWTIVRVKCARDK